MPQFPSIKDGSLRMKMKHIVAFIPLLMEFFDQLDRLKTSNQIV